jgi:iron complex outermembrane receptor protein
MSTKVFSIVLAHVCAFLICVLQMTPAYAEEAVTFDESQSSVQQLPEILVTDTRLPSIQENILAVPAKVTVISAEDIQQSGARTVQEAVAQATGVVMYDQVGNAFEQRIDLRGYNGNPVSSTSVFVDGVRVNEPDFNLMNFDLIPLETIERMEIIPGASAIYGKNAMGGVINIFTKRGSKQRQITGETAWGSFGRQRYTLDTSGPVGKLDYYGSLSREREDGFRDGSAAKLWRGFGKIGYRPVDGTDLAVSYTYIKDNLEQAGSLPLSLADDNPEANFTPGDFVDRENNFVRMTARQVIPGGFTFTGNGFYRRLQQE